MEFSLPNAHKSTLRICRNARDSLLAWHFPSSFAPCLRNFPQKLFIKVFSLDLDVFSTPSFASRAWEQQKTAVCSVAPDSEMHKQTKIGKENKNKSQNRIARAGDPRKALHQSLHAPGFRSLSFHLFFIGELSLRRLANETGLSAGKYLRSPAASERSARKLSPSENSPCSDFLSRDPIPASIARMRNDFFQPPWKYLNYISIHAEPAKVECWMWSKLNSCAAGVAARATANCRSQ